MNLAGSCSLKDVESQLFSPGKTTWQKSHAICWKNSYFLEMVQIYRRWVNPCLQGDHCPWGSRLQHSCSLSKIISFSFFISSWRSWWAGMALLQQQMHSPLLGTDGKSQGIRKAARNRGEAKSKKKPTTKPWSLLLQCWGWASCAGNGSGLPIGIIYNLQMMLKSALLIFA